MKLRISILALLSVITLSSCVVIGITNDYNKLTDTEKSFITPFTTFDNSSKGHIYEINAQVLLTEMKKYPRSMVYLFANGCSSPNCFPLSVYENYAEKYGYKLYLVMVGYGNVYHTLVQNIESPLYTIDTKYYDNKYQFRYLKCFTNELRGYNKDAKIKGDRYVGPLYFFENGDLKVISSKLPEADALARK